VLQKGDHFGEYSMLDDAPLKFEAVAMR